MAAPGNVPSHARDLELISRPHVVILGAGASRAAFPRGDRNGRALPLMSDFLDIVPVRKVLLDAGVDVDPHGNFEAIYGNLSRDKANAALLQSVEQIVYEYFNELEITDQPTIYDHLLLSLRKKDVIATFNWDPLLLKAACRNPILKDRMPTIHFLHGNVSFAYCYADGRRGMKGMPCSRCGEPFGHSRLLYPVLEKDYSDPSTVDSWSSLQNALRSACFITIFGYSAPVADQKARRLLLEGWGDPRQRELEQIEIIDVGDEAVIKNNWEPFIHPDHYEIHRDFFESWIARHPRRTAEAWWGQYLDGTFLQEGPLPQAGSVARIWGEVQPLIKAEEHAVLVAEQGVDLL